MRHRLLVTSLVGLLAAAVCAPAASATVKIKLNPGAPVVDDSVRVSFRTDRKLKPGYHWQASILGHTCGYASSFVYKDSTRKVRKGKVMSFSLSPYDDVLNESSEWCQGKATVMVMTARDDGRDGGSMVGIRSFRFYGMP
jgi:hypothetical protein